MNSGEPGISGLLPKILSRFRFSRKRVAPAPAASCSIWGLLEVSKSRDILSWRAKKSHQTQDHREKESGGATIIKSAPWAASSFTASWPFAASKIWAEHAQTGHDAPDQEPDVFLKLNNDKTIVFHGTSLQLTFRNYGRNLILSVIRSIPRALSGCKWPNGLSKAETGDPY